MVIILDIDSTLVTHQLTYSSAKPSGPGAPDFILDNPRQVGLPIGQDIIPLKVWVYKRPYLDEFMQFCLANFDVGVWTAALPVWRDYILNTALAPYKDKLVFAWSREDTDIRLGWVPRYIKPLSKVWAKFPTFNSENTLLIDDYKNVTGFPATEACCHLQIVPFTIKPGMETDRELLKILYGLRILLRRDGKVHTRTLIKAYNNMLFN